jgi:hypothetical protein
VEANNASDSIYRTDKRPIGHEYFSGPFGVSVGSEDHLYVVDDLAHQISVLPKRASSWKQSGEKAIRLASLLG